MAPKRLNLSSLTGEFISENSEIPHDITFRFTEGDLSEVSAHKMILGMVSTVFRKMFFVHNTRDKSAKKIVMKDTNGPAFKIMIEAIYNSKSMEEILRGKTLHEIFAVLYLVTQYEISDLVQAVKDCISSFPITEVDSVVEVATDAMEYLPTFEEDAHNVLRGCAKFLHSKLTNVTSFRGFVTKNGDRLAVVHKLLVLIDEMIPPLCSNCRSDPCLHEVPVKSNQIGEGLKVADNPSNTHTPGGWNSKLLYITGETLKTVERNKVKVKGKWRFQGLEEKSGVTKENEIKIHPTKKFKLASRIKCNRFNDNDTKALETFERLMNDESSGEESDVFSLENGNRSKKLR